MKLYENGKKLLIVLLLTSVIAVCVTIIFQLLPIDNKSSLSAILTSIIATLVALSYLKFGKSS